MKKIISTLSALAVIASAVPTVTFADNPLAQNVFTADPAPMVYDGTLYLYTSHDNDNAEYFDMPDWQCYSTTDMQNWTHHGTVLSDSDFKYAEEKTAWATQCVERDGKFYMYCPLSNASGGGRVIGVGVSDSPTGPFKDAIGKPLLGPNWDYIDPTVFIDDDGQAYLYFGNPQLYYVKLNDDMISYSGEIQKVNMTTGAFGSGDGANDRTGTLYTEGPWFYKRGNLYYMLYAASGIPENICYSTSTSPTGPWKYQGVIMPKGEQGAAFTNHCGVADYKGHSYFFYHNQRLPDGGGFDRSVAVEEFTYNPDGTFPTIKMSESGPEQLEALNPYKRVEAETMCFESGIETEVCSNGGMNVANIENGDYVKVSGVDFGDGAESFTASVASATDGGKIEIHLDSLNGEIVGVCNVPSTDGWQKWEEVTCDVSGAEGRHDVYFKYSGGSGYLFNVDWWKFNSSSVSETPEQPSADGIIFRDTFESGVNGWKGRGSAKVSSSNNAKYEGSKALYTSDRESSWNGALKELSIATFVPGQAYSFSVNVMCPTANKMNRFYLTLQYNDADGEAHYDKIAKCTAMGGDWVQLANTSYTIPADAKELFFYVETEEGRADFYIDDAVGAVKGTKIVGAGNSKAVRLGDVNCDGRVDVFDAIEARKGLVNGFEAGNPSINADADRNGEANINDVVLIHEYIIGKISEFPKADPIEPEKEPFDYDANLQYKEAPGEYLNAECAHKGKVVNETYNGINGSNKLNVYLPYGYDESKKYNVFYLMHGGGENENTIFSNDVKFANMLDHMIENGDIEPMIVVTPTFNKCKAETVWEEVKKSIVPFVEGKYSTYAEDTTPDGLEASRLHRAYGGFSMGGGSTWNVLLNNIEYFAYYMPLSGHCWSGAGAVAEAIEKSKYKDSTYILAATGTKDIAYGNLKPQIDAMKEMSTFTYTSDFSKGNLYFLEVPELTHWWGYVRHYVYDALPYFFHN